MQELTTYLNILSMNRFLETWFLTNPQTTALVLFKIFFVLYKEDATNKTVLRR